MGLIGQILSTLFGGDRNAVRELAEVFRVNAEAASKRGHDLDSAALDQFAAEFCRRTRRTWWDSLIDGLNRLPRPMLVLGVFVMLIWSVADPVFMAKVFSSWAIIPAPVWALIMVIVTFYFGGRQQAKGLEFQRDVAGLMAQTQTVLNSRESLDALEAGDAPPEAAPEVSDNPALDAWRASK
ncbi:MULTISPECIES: 3TM-type holin [unclassified Mameliella]|uniref:3TM-type holin n=1 Tax=unclassified Mameliella TaxID=2630630 RepID=UPI00273D987F|nr:MULTISPECIES: 3TM-type holin [unclassified Mameliella]